jgi:sterol desaturase/sphingolipid hydroxylase (fatty acid hydroxylase superfamily)
MGLLHNLYDELVGFMGLGALLKMYQTGNYQSLLTLDGILGAVSPVLPFLLLIEIVRALVYKRFKIEDYRMPFIIFVINRVIGRFLSIAAIAFCIGVFEKYALFKTSFTWYWLIYGYIIWEFGHFLYHYWGHTVRLFWCLHATHHTPQTMNLSVSYAHFFLEGAYADIIRTTVCILAGVNPPLLFFIMFIDGLWGGFIHVGEGILRDGRLGFLNKWILTPSHHRVHHAKNPLYMDTNFCNLLNIWDRVFGTYQHEVHSLPVEYGVSRNVNNRNFFDVYFGEFYYLSIDVWNAPGILNKIRYIFMPPGWSHTGAHKTAVIVKREWIESQKSTTHEPETIHS